MAGETFAVDGMAKGAYRSRYEAARRAGPTEEIARHVEQDPRGGGIREGATPILQQIDATLAAIEAAQQPHQTRRDEILNLQSKVAEQVAACNTALAQITRLQQMAVGGIFTPENPPIWDANLRARAALPCLTAFPISPPRIGGIFSNMSTTPPDICRGTLPSL